MTPFFEKQMQLLNVRPRPCVRVRGQRFAHSFSWPVVNLESNPLSILLSIDTAHFFSKSSLSACFLTNIPDKTNETKWGQIRSWSAPSFLFQHQNRLCNDFPFLTTADIPKGSLFTRTPYFFLLFYFKDEHAMFYDITCCNIIRKIPVRVKHFKIQLLLFNSF